MFKCLKILLNTLSQDLDDGAGKFADDTLGGRSGWYTIESCCHPEGPQEPGEMGWQEPGELSPAHLLSAF